MLRLVLLFTLALAAPAGAARPVVRPPLPSPMPAVIRSECPYSPGLGCFLVAGASDGSGRTFRHGAVFTDGGRFVTAHELGHAFDETRMDATERTLFALVVRRGSDPWDDLHATSEAFEAPLAEVFADAYASCRLRRTGQSGVWETGYGYYPSPRRHRRVCRIITRAAAGAGTPLRADGWR